MRGLRHTPDAFKERPPNSADTIRPVAELRAGVARCYFSKLTGKLIEEEQQLSATVTIGGGTQSTPQSTPGQQPAS